MKPFVVANHPKVVAWVEAELGISFLPPYTSLGFFKRDQIVAGVVFHMWTACDVEMAARALPGGISRRDIQGIADYVFEKEGKRRMTLITPVSNTAARKAAERLGFELECIRKDYFPEEDGAMFRLLKNDCRWI